MIGKTFKNTFLWRNDLLIENWEQGSEQEIVEGVLD